jgi:outer membrane protein TolC
MIKTSKNKFKLPPATYGLCLLIIALITTGTAAKSNAAQSIQAISSSIQQTNNNTQNSERIIISLNDAVKRAIKGSFEIRQLQNKVNSATDSHAVSLRDPELRLSYEEDNATVERHRWNTTTGSSTTGKNDNDSSEYRVAMRFFLPNIWTHSSIELQQKSAYKAAESELKAAKQKITTEIRLSFAKLNYLEQSRRLSEQLVTLYANKQSKVDQLTAAGNLSTLDNIDFSRRHLKALSELTHIENDFNRELKNLAERICLPLNSFIPVIENRKLLQIDTSDAGINELHALMMQNRADLTALGWRKIEAEATLKTLQREHMPWFRHVQFSYGAGSGSSSGGDIETSPSERSQYSYRDDDADGDEWAVTTAISIPLYGTGGSDSRLLTMQVQQAATAETSKIKQAELQLKDACHSLRRTSLIRKQHRQRTLPLIHKIKTAIDSAGTASNLSFEDQMLLYRDLSEAKRLQLELDFNYRTSLIELDRIIGLPLFHLSAQ